MNYQYQTKCQKRSVLQNKKKIYIYIYIYKVSHCNLNTQIFQLQCIKKKMFQDVSDTSCRGQKESSNDLDLDLGVKGQGHFKIIVFSDKNLPF